MVCPTCRQSLNEGLLQQLVVENSGNRAYFSQRIDPTTLQAIFVFDQVSLNMEYRRFAHYLNTPKGTQGYQVLMRVNCHSFAGHRVLFLSVARS